MLNKNLKTFIYDDNEYVLLKKHSCLKKDTTNLITIDSDLDSYILFCGDFHPWIANSCEFRAIKKDIFDPDYSIKYYLNQIEDLLSIEVHDEIINW